MIVVADNPELAKELLGKNLAEDGEEDWYEEGPATMPCILFSPTES